MDLLDTFWEWIKGLLVFVVGLVAWIYRSDRSEVKQMLHAHGKQISDLEASRPSRDELASEVRGLREEMREDIADLKEDVTTRLDILIRLTQERR